MPNDGGVLVLHLEAHGYFQRHPKNALIKALLRLY
jgi:hypothetical protein